MRRHLLQVAVVSPHQLTRAGLTTLLAQAPDRVQVHDVADRDGHLGGHDVTIYDLVALIDSPGSDLAHLIATEIPVVALEPQGRPDLGEGALSLGAAQVIRMDISSADLVTVVEQAARGECVECVPHQSEIYSQLVEQFSLTEREIGVLDLIASGLSNDLIAARLYLSINSIKSYIRQAYKKIGVTSRSQAVLWSVQHGLGATGYPPRGH